KQQCVTAPPLLSAYRAYQPGAPLPSPIAAVPRARATAAASGPLRALAVSKPACARYACTTSDSAASSSTTRTIAAARSVSFLMATVWSSFLEIARLQRCRRTIWTRSRGTLDENFARTGEPGWDHVAYELDPPRRHSIMTH